MNDGEVEREGTWRPKLIAAAIVLALLLIFTLANATTVKVQFVFAHVETRLAWALLIAAALGFVLGLLLPRLRR
jgi:uncharacterized integral membrane protein